MIRLATLLLFAACASWAEDDEVRFKPKAYQPGKTLPDATYQASAYAPAKAAQGSTGARLEKARGGFWGLFKAKPLENAPSFEDAPEAQKAPFVQTRQISAPSMTADPGATAEHKPFVSNEKKLEDEGFAAPQRPREKNPLLAPRQGIKVPE